MPEGSGRIAGRGPGQPGAAFPASRTDTRIGRDGSCFAHPDPMMGAARQTSKPSRAPICVSALTRRSPATHPFSNVEDCSSSAQVPPRRPVHARGALRQRLPRQRPDPCVPRSAPLWTGMVGPAKSLATLQRPAMQPREARSRRTSSGRATPTRAPVSRRPGHPRRASLQDVAVSWLRRSAPSPETPTRDESIVGGDRVGVIEEPATIDPALPVAEVPLTPGRRLV
jgi:hypothetical protein